MSSSPVFDPNRLLNRLGGNRKLFDELIDLFREEGPGNLETIRLGIDVDSAAVKLGSHTLKSSLCYFDAYYAIELAGHLEKKANGKNLDGASATFSLLESQVQLLLEELTRIDSKTPIESGEKRS